MKKLIALLIAISLCACSSQKKALHKDTDKHKVDRYHEHNGFKTKRTPIFDGW